MNESNITISYDKGVELIRRALNRRDIGRVEQCDAALREILKPLEDPQDQVIMLEGFRTGISASEILQAIIENTYGE
jgi:hypothetical protein